MVILGAYGDMSALARSIVWFIIPRIWRRPSRAWLNAAVMTFSEIPEIFVSN